MPPKRKKRPSSRKRGILLETPPAPQPLIPESTELFQPVVNHAPASWTFLLMAVSFVLGIYFWKNHHAENQTVFFILSALVGISYFLNLRSLKQLLFLVGLGWVLVALSFGTAPFLKYAFSFLTDFSLPHPLLQFALGMGLLAAFWRFLPPADPTRDISQGWARLWFWVIFAVAAYLRMHKINEPVGCYWDDGSVALVDSRGILEFHERPMLMPLAHQEPFFDYFLAGLWSLMPNAYAIFIHRLGCAILDLIAVWLFYLLGKEVGGRRAGLVACALGAVSRPMIIGVLLGYPQVNVPMAVSLILLMTVRVFKKPDWSHFIQWGLALGFAPYNYTSLRPWLPFLVTSVFAWIWFSKQKNENQKLDFWLGWGTLLTWVFLFLKFNNFLPKQSPWVDFLNQHWFNAAVLLVLWVAFFGLARSPRVSGEPSLMPRMFFGVFLASLIIFPLASDPMIAVHSTGHSIFHKDSALHVGGDAVRLLWDKTWRALQTMFLSGQDRDDMNIPQSVFFDYHFIPVFVLGFVSLLSQPSWMKLFLLVGALVGISPHVLSDDPHSGKLIGCVVPMAILSGLAVQQAYSAFSASFRSLFSGFLAGLLFLGYFGWAFWGTYDRAWTHYFNRNRVDKTASLQVLKYALEKRVYLTNFVSPQTQSLLSQGFDYYLLKPQNPIYLKPGEKPRDVVVVMSSNDLTTKSLIDSQFPNASWELLDLTGRDEGNVPAARRAIIAASEITDNPGKLFYYQQVPADNWTRNYLTGRFILGVGMIDTEESVSSPSNPVPESLGGRMVNLKGDFNLPSANKVTFKVTSYNYVVLLVDGKKVLDVKPFQKALKDSGSLNLSAGVHHVFYMTLLRAERAIPQITLSVGGGPEMLLGGNPP